MKMREMWKRLTTTRYARELEVELARLRSENKLLRAENRGLLNSILGIAGVPPVPASAEDLAVVENRSIAAPRNAGARAERAHVAVPMRKRSWQQINRMLEFESARKDKPGVDAMAGGRT